MDPLQHLLNMANQHGLLTPLPMSTARWRTSMYGDDATIFINPLKDDLEALKTILPGIWDIFRPAHKSAEKLHPPD